MKFNTFFMVIGCYFLICGAVLNNNNNNLKLDLVQIIFRHGARTPNKDEAQYINVNDSTLYGEYGRLTDFGKKQSYKLGQLLNATYGEFLNGYDSKEIYALSTDYNRTRATMQIVLSGLFPSLKAPLIHHITNNSCDLLLASTQTKKFKEIHHLDSQEEIKKIISRYVNLLEFLSEKTKKSYKDEPLIYFASKIYHSIKIHKMLNLTLPQWADHTVLNVTKELFKIGLNSMSSTQKLKKLNGGMLVKQFIKNIDLNKNRKNPRKIYLYCAHDLTVAGFTIAGGLTLTRAVEFGEAIIVEKYKDEHNNDYIRMIGWDGEKPSVLKMESCEEYCPLREYKIIVKDMIPSDEEFMATTVC